MDVVIDCILLDYYDRQFIYSRDTVSCYKDFFKITVDKYLDLNFIESKFL